jgi:hypothetical protein
MGAEIWSHTRNFGHNGKQVYKNITKLASCWGMSSGGYNIRVLLQEGFDRIVICGTPMEPKVHHITRRDKSGNPVPWIEANDFWDNWKERFFEMKDTVRSTSGRSQRLLGAPTEKWIRGESEPLTVYGASIRPRKA